MSSEETRHSLYSPSGAHRWVACPASIQAHLYVESLEGAIIIDKTPSKFALEGTLAHEIAAEALQHDLLVETDEFKGDDLDAINSYIDYVSWLSNEDDDAVLFIETKAAIPSVHDECYGTIDAAIISDDQMHVIDLKFGRQVPVDAKENLQMIMYASGMLDDDLLFIKKPDDDYKITLHIYMPRIRYYPPHYQKNWETTAGEIRAIIYGVREAALVIDKQITDGGMPTKHFNPSEKTCQWCDLKPICKPHKTMLIDDFDDLDADILILTGEELQEMFLRSKEIATYLAAVEEHILQQFGIDDEHDEFPKLKIGMGRPTSVWANEKDVIQAFDDKGLNARGEAPIKGITVARKELKDKALVDGLIRHLPGKRKLMEK